MKAIDILRREDQKATIYLGGQILVQGLSAVSVFIFTRLLTTEEYGVVAIYTTCSTFLSYFIGMQSYGTIGIAKVHKSDKYEKYCVIPYVLTLITTILFLAIALFFLNTIDKLLGLSGPIVIFMFLYTAGITFFSIQNSIYRMDMKAVNYVSNNLSVNLMAIIVSIVLIIGFNRGGDTGRILGMGIPYILFGFFFFYKAIKRTGFFFDKELYGFCVKLSVPLVLHGISAQVLSHSDILMLGNMRGDVEAGIYSFCYSVAGPLVGIWSAYNAAWQPEYLVKKKEGNEKWLKEHSNNYLFNFTLLMCGYLLVCREILKIMGSENYWIGEEIISLIVVASYLQFLYSFPSTYEFFRGKTKMIAIGTGAAAVVNILINLFFVPQFGILAAAGSTVIAYLVLFLMHDLFARRLGGYHYSWGFYLKGLIPVIMCVLLTYLLKDYIAVRWGIGIVIGIILGRHLLKTKTLL